MNMNIKIDKITKVITTKSNNVCSKSWVFKEILKTSKMPFPNVNQHFVTTVILSIMIICK